MTGEGHVSKRDLATYFGVDKRTIDRWVRLGCPSLKLPSAVPERGNRRFRIGDVEAWLEGQPADGDAAA